VPAARQPATVGCAPPAATAMHQRTRHGRGAMQTGPRQTGRCPRGARHCRNEQGLTSASGRIGSGLAGTPGQAAGGAVAAARCAGWGCSRHGRRLAVSHGTGPTVLFHDIAHRIHTSLEQLHSFCLHQSGRRCASDRSALPAARKGIDSSPGENPWLPCIQTEEAPPVCQVDPVRAIRRQRGAAENGAS
jgi:hypothetical protein